MTSEGSIRVMLVDDSAVVRGLMQRALQAEPSIEVVSTAGNGEMALTFLKRTPADIIVLDVEMPIMDGLTALPALLKVSPTTKIIMASTLTMRNAEISMQAMELGAADYVPKPSSNQPGEVDEFYLQLIHKIKALAPRRAGAVFPSPKPAPTFTHKTTVMPTLEAPKIVPVRSLAGAPTPLAGAIAIASSTGGPQALINVFTALKGKKLTVPIFITQHMPPNFTTILADHISKTVGGDCHEAVDGEEVKSGVIYLAPGDFHMTVERPSGIVRLRLDKNPQENFCRPAADPMLRSLAAIYGKKLVVAVLTGMGSDGAKGAAHVVNAGGVVVAQDEASSVVYGMPKAVVDAQLAAAILPLDQIGAYVAKTMGG